MAVRTNVTTYTNSGTTKDHINDLLSLYDRSNSDYSGSKYGGAIGTGSGIITYVYSNTLTQAEKNMFVQAANLWSSVANVQFAQVDGIAQANIKIQNTLLPFDPKDAFAEAPVKPYSVMSINIGGKHGYQGNPQTFAEAQAAQANFTHEVGHLLGLSHPQDTTITTTGSTTEALSVMSYIRYVTQKEPLTK